MPQAILGIDYKEKLIGKLEGLLPGLIGNVYEGDIVTITTAYDGLKQNPNDDTYVHALVPQVVISLRGTVRTEEKYRNKNVRRIVKQAIGVLESIAKS
ncbi:hypothetical protein HYX05_01530 [Candidatus Woesearchaeota archaeon]|nr:hypothetical protein [Candidatus Woesearchaeota archaeon]